MFARFLSKFLAFALFLPYACWVSVFGDRARLNRFSFFSVIALLLVFHSVFSRISGVKLVMSDAFFTDNAGHILQEKVASGRVASGQSKFSTGLIDSSVSVSSGQTLSHILGEASIGNSQIFSITNKPEVAGVRFVTGQIVKLSYSCDVEYKEAHVSAKVSNGSTLFPPRYSINKDCTLYDMKIPLQGGKVLEYSLRDGKGEVGIKVLKTKVTNKVVRGIISSSLYGDALRNSVPAVVINRVLKEYGYLLDFQRDIQQNDVFAVVFEEVRTESGELVRHGNLLFANLILRGKTHPIYLYKDEYYNEKGESVKKTLLKTPIDGARITSPFGKRTHPILGYTREHKGIDFGAPTGTPVYSAGDGVVEFVGVKSGYGKFVTIKHNRELKTNYAHLHGFGKIKTGDKVSQRQVVGYVGSTGMATGPHLHFEMVVNNQKVNPKSSYFSSSKKISGADIPLFDRFKESMHRSFNNAGVVSA